MAWPALTPEPNPTECPLLFLLSPRISVASQRWSCIVWEAPGLAFKGAEIILAQLSQMYSSEKGSKPWKPSFFICFWDLASSCSSPCHCNYEFLQSFMLAFLCWELGSQTGVGCSVLPHLQESAACQGNAELGCHLMRVPGWPAVGMLCSPSWTLPFLSHRAVITSQFSYSECNTLSVVFNFLDDYRHRSP